MNGKTSNPMRQDAKPPEVETAPRTRMIFMGSAALTTGFGLIGFETWPNATAEVLENLLQELVSNHESALVFLESDLARCGCPSLDKVRAESARIVITEVPPLHTPGEYHLLVEDLIESILGASAVEEVKGR